MRHVGFSTGCWYKTKTPMAERLRQILKYGGDAVEITFLRKEYFDEFELTEEILDLLKQFKYVSVHGPAVDFRYGMKEKEYLMKIKDVYNKINAECCVVHPDLIDDIEIFKEVKMNWVLENMDHRKDFGKIADDLLKFDFHICLDLCHAAMVDETMKNVDDFHAKLGDKVKEIHISGNLDGNRHAPLYLADDRDLIVEKARMFPDVPLISEGTLDDFNEEVVKKAVEFLRRV